MKFESTGTQLTCTTTHTSQAIQIYNPSSSKILMADYWIAIGSGATSDPYKDSSYWDYLDVR